MGFPRALWLGILAVALVGVGFLVYRRQRLSIDPAQITLPADGAEHSAVRIRVPQFPFTGTVTEAGSPKIRLLASQRGILEGMLLAPINPGHSELKLVWRHLTTHVPVTFVFDPRTATQMEPPTSFASTLPRTARPSATGSLPSRKPRRTTQAYPPRSTIAPRCSALLTEKPCLPTTQPGFAAILRKPLIPRSAIRLPPNSAGREPLSASAPAHSALRTWATAASPSSQTRVRSWNGTPTSSDATFARPGRVTLFFIAS